MNTTAAQVTRNGLISLNAIARRAAGMSDACAANGWATTAYAWQAVDYSEAEALAYWASIEDEDERADQIVSALESVGKTMRDVFHVMS